MNSYGKIREQRATNAEPLTMHMDDDENTFMFQPINMNQNSFFGTRSTLNTL